MPQPISPASPTTSSSSKHTYGESKADPSRYFKSLQSQIQELEDCKAQDQYYIAELQRQIREDSSTHQQEVTELQQDLMAVKQDMMLDMLKVREDGEKKLQISCRAKMHVQQQADELKTETATLKQKVDTLTSKYTKALTDSCSYRDEVEHLQAQKKSLEEDVDALRQIENEEAARREHLSQGLPPAYGELNDKDQLPPYSQHKDSGAFDVASFKKTVRSQFMHTLSDAESRRGTLRNSTQIRDLNEADNMMFYTLSIALCDACRQLRTALDAAQSVLSTHIIQLAAKANTKDLSDLTTKPEVKSQIARREYIADRVAKLILDLSGRVVAACALRPTILRLSSQEKAKLGLAYAEADQCLLEALRHAFSNSNGNTSKDPNEVSETKSLQDSKAEPKANVAYEYQGYLMQVQTAQDHFLSLGAGISYCYFSRAISWLEEQVETERFWSR